MIVSAQYSITSTAAVVVDAYEGYRNAFVHVTSNGACYVGPAGVTASTGLYIDKNSGIPQINIPPGDALYAVAASGTETLTVLVTGP